MDIFEKALEEDVPLQIRLNESTPRLMAALFKTADGICFFDIGWFEESGGFPVHFVNGIIEGDLPFQINDFIVEPIINDEDLKTWQMSMDFEKEAGITKELKKVRFDEMYKYYLEG